MMHLFAMLAGMSFDIGGVGGLLSGIFSRSFKRAIVWSCFWGILNCLVFWQLVQYGEANIVTIVPFFLAVFWAAIGWFLLGARRANKRNEITNKSEKMRLSIGDIVGSVFQVIETMLVKIWRLHNRILETIGIHIYYEKYPWLYVITFLMLGAFLPPLAVVYALAGMFGGAERSNVSKVD